MDTTKYIKESSRTCPSLGSRKLEARDLDNIHMVMGISTEAGELLDTFKKYLAYKKPLDWVNIKEEIGDIMWYLMNMCSINALDFNEILDTNIKKLRARYPEKFTEEKANNRDLEKERKILEK